jgi:hypothetical protein
MLIILSDSVVCMPDMVIFGQIIGYVRRICNDHSVIGGPYKNHEVLLTAIQIQTVCSICQKIASAVRESNRNYK